MKYGDTDFLEDHPPIPPRYKSYYQPHQTVMGYYMLRDDPNRPHRDTVAYIRRNIRNKFNTNRAHIEAAKDIETLDEAHEAHIRAKTAFATVNSDQTMINLIGTWACLNRVIMEMDDKYGSRQ